jgi:hypothetical protein
MLDGLDGSIRFRLNNQKNRSPNNAESNVAAAEASEDYLYSDILVTDCEHDLRLQLRTAPKIAPHRLPIKKCDMANQVLCPQKWLFNFVD